MIYFEKELSELRPTIAMIVNDLIIITHTDAKYFLFLLKLIYFQERFVNDLDLTFKSII